MNRYHNKTTVTITVICNGGNSGNSYNGGNGGNGIDIFLYMNIV